MKKAQKGASVKKNIKDATENKNMRAPFTTKERKSMPKVSNMGSAKNGMSCGGKMSKKK